MLDEGFDRQHDKRRTSPPPPIDRPRLIAAIERAGGQMTVPQIFIDDRHVGGCTDLHELERNGRLDPLLSGT